MMHRLNRPGQKSNFRITRLWLNDMKALLIIALLVWGTSCLAQSAQEGSYIVVRGAVEGCEVWSDRILDVVKVDNDTPIKLLGIPDISVAGLTHKQIKSNLLMAVENHTGKKPESITVKILGIRSQIPGNIDRLPDEPECFVGRDLSIFQKETALSGHGGSGREYSANP